ncbi:nuclear transport factor 2 family protein [Pseudomonas viridiflava]|uniref:nuclear transport factor 2 family protein n=2 Tax=Pseudomonas viridiflava TaxID=33069 RepID=UPI000F010F19|nr:nuclear transport factor 2 family protein [Pseudomonas viridiflava]
MNKTSYVQEHQAIVNVVNKYNEGCRQAVSSIMKPAFSDQATIFGVNAESKLVGGPIQGLFNSIDKPPFHFSSEFCGVIASIDVVGNAAIARIDSNDFSGFCFTDFLSLLKVEGEWTVVCKIYHTHTE